MKIFRTYIIHSARHIPTLDDKHICKNMHGHTFNILVELDGPINKRTGFVMDFFDLDNIVKREVITKIDHRVLNEIKGLENPTSEVLAKWIWDRMICNLPQLTEVVVEETCTCKCVYSGT